MWVSSTVAWIPDAIYMRGNEPIDMDALAGRDCYAGLDLSSTGDITALVLIFPPRDEEEKYVLLPYFWIPEETIPRRVKANSVPYDIWEKQGYIMSTEGNVIHYDFIEKFIMDLSEKYHILEIAVDRWNATQMIQNLETRDRRTCHADQLSGRRGGIVGQQTRVGRLLDIGKGQGGGRSADQSRKGCG